MFSITFSVDVPGELVMIRIFAAAAAALLFSACGGESTPVEPAAAAPVEPAPEAAAPDPTALPTPAAEGGRVGAMNLLCGGATFRVAFEDARAVVVNDDGSNNELALLPAGANAAPGVSTYTDGKMTFAKSGGGDTPTVIRFARGKMAFEDCNIAQN
jgi:hypothetical protein